MHVNRYRLLLMITLVWIAAFRSNSAGETPRVKNYPLWDGKESVADYANRVGFETAMSFDLGDGVKMDFVLIPPGKFMMGSHTEEKDRNDNEGPQHEVTITTPFYMGKFEVTQEQYEKLIKENPSHFKGAKNPVENVSWQDTKNFCKQMSQQTGRIVRLPSEAEWEYACRAGSTTPFHPPREREKGSPLTDEQRRRVADLIPKLSSTEFKMRDKATRDLIALGSGVVPLLDSVKMVDMETQSRLASVKSAFEPPQGGLEGVAWFDKVA
jgi:formylglycine-generating enzyme required for sulfatase activity